MEDEEAYRENPETDGYDKAVQILTEQGIRPPRLPVPEHRIDLARSEYRVHDPYGYGGGDGP